jgi:hypothetical protein
VSPIDEEAFEEHICAWQVKYGGYAGSKRGNADSKHTALCRQNRHGGASGLSRMRDGGESTGHAEGRRIVELLRTKESDLTDDDLAHMRKVHGYVARHLAQGRSSEIFFIV